MAMNARFTRYSEALFAHVRLALTLGVISLSQLACGEEELGDPTGSTCPTQSTLSYSNFGQQFIQTNCLTCHGAAGPQTPTLSTVEQIRANSDAIDRAAAAGPDATNTFMPDEGSVATEERRKLGEWLACGAP
jgi:hypothetical protein